MNAPVKKDFFVSYNRRDRTFAEWIAWTLEEAGYTVVIQAWDFCPGENFVLQMQRAASEAERTIAVLSPNYLQSLYTQPEWAAAFAQDPTGTNRKLIPIRVAECDLTGMLASLIYVDLVGLSEAEAEEEVLKAAQLKRSKPSEKPRFPGQVSHREKPSFPPQNIQNNSGGQNYQVNHPTAPVIQGGSGNTINISYGMTATPPTRMSTTKRQRLEQDQSRLQGEWSLRQEKLSTLRQAFAIEASAAVQFQLKHQIKTEEDAIAALEAQLDTIEQELSSF